MNVSFSGLLNYVALPKAMTEFERRYLERMNKVALLFFAAHVPFLAVVALVNSTKPWLAIVLSLLGLVGPAYARSAFTNPRRVSMVFGVVAMYFGALLVHFGQGPVQIEMHFYFFALLAMLAVFGNPSVILAATVTVAAHHLALWIILPSSVFNYGAPVWVVAVHAGFVVLEAVAVCYIARNFFDNVIGLEKIVAARTRALDARNADLRLVLDNVAQGLVTIDADGVLLGERSLTFTSLFGGDATTMFEAFETRAPAFATQLSVAWDALKDAVLPIELLMDQLPRRFSSDDHHYEVTFLPVVGHEGAHFLLVVTDVTEAVQREKSDRERLELLHLFERAVSDRPALEEYLMEASKLVHDLSHAKDADGVTFKRQLHTLKGNSAIMGLSSVAELCHEIENQIAEGKSASQDAAAPIEECWAHVTTGMQSILQTTRRGIELEPDEYDALEREAALISLDLWRSIRRLRLDPVRRRFERLQDQAVRIAERLGKSIKVVIEDNGVRLDGQTWAPFFSSLVHSIRNAVDHGLETAEEREANGKSAVGTLSMRSWVDDSGVHIEVADDGRGVRWERLREKAQRQGLPADTREDLVEALFTDGMSTAEDVSDISGRGVGMSALRACVESLRGTVRILSDGSSGTCIAMTFPPSAVERERHARAA